MLSLSNAIFAVALRRMSVIGTPQPLILSFTTIAVNLEGAVI